MFKENSMKKLNKILAVTFGVLLLSQGVFATTFTDKFIKCSPYVQDEGNRLIQVAGYVNRVCVYRELSLDNNLQCEFARKQKTLINQELKLRNYQDTSLDFLQTYDKYKNDGDICKNVTVESVKAKK